MNVMIRGKGQIYSVVTDFDEKIFLMCLNTNQNNNIIENCVFFGQGSSNTYQKKSVFEPKIKFSVSLF